MTTPRHALAGLPVILRAGVIGAFATGSCGAIAGLIIGLRAYAPTAWFAVIEVGLPAAVLGGLLGLLTGSVLQLVRRARRGSGL